MTETKLPEATEALIFGEIHRMREDYARSVGSTIKELTRISDSGISATDNLPVFARKSAIATVSAEVLKYLNRAIDEGLGTCFDGWSMEHSKVDSSLLPVVIKALQNALLLKGFEVNDKLDFIRFVDSEQQTILEARIVKSALEERARDIKQSIAAVDCSIASLTRTATEAEEKARAANDEKVKALGRKTKLETEMFNVVRTLGKRCWPDESQPKRARVDDVVDVDMEGEIQTRA